MRSPGFTCMSARRIVQWPIASVALAFDIQHAVVLASEPFMWQADIREASMVVWGFGRPVVMTFAWCHGERASRRISGPELTIISLLLVMSSLMFYVFVRPSEPIATAPSAQQVGIAVARTAAASPKGAISLAVLPFANMSGDASQD